ncbi:MAG: L-lactate dehydrogenase, partial [Clostridiales bacterium]|nr:L-lactate dehydrogenase [Clostridiales bacterium]
TNPCDIIAHHIWRISGFDKSKVFATGTMLDSMRFCQALSRETGLDPQRITGYTMGEHGDSQIAIWSHVSLDGAPLLSSENNIDPEQIINEVRGQAWNIADGKGATEFGISVALSKIVQSIYSDEKAIYPLSTLLKGQYGISDLFASTPCVLGRNGIEKVIELNLTDDERRGYHDSCDVIKNHINTI